MLSSATKEAAVNKNIQFDSHAFAGRRARPVSPATRIAFEDYSRMSSYQRKPSGERRLPTPEWALDDSKLRELLVVFMEERCGIKNSQGTLLERLELARQAVIAQHSRMRDTLNKMCLEYVQLKNRGAKPET